MFDHSAFTDGKIDRQIVDEVNAVVAHARSLLIDQLDTRGPTRGYIVAAYAQSFFQAHLRRALEFLDGGMAAHKANQPLVAATCARSILESVACFHDFCRRLPVVLNEGDGLKALKFITGQAFATKLTYLHDDDGSNKATNIMTQLDRLEKSHPGLRAIYDQLSETTHPNGMGAVAHFTHMDPDVGIMRFGPSDRQQANLVRLLGTANFLEQMPRDMETLGIRLDTFIRDEEK